MTILIKGDEVAFGAEGGEPIEGLHRIVIKDHGVAYALPKRYGIIHDPKGKQLPRCEVFFGPYRRIHGHVEMTREARHYFGRTYQPKKVVIDRPVGTWNSVANVVKIYYYRGGKIAPGGFHHTFKGAPLLLSKSGRFYRLSLGSGCIVDDRGFVFP